jgi:hypothetical protein
MILSRKKFEDTHFVKCYYASMTTAGLEFDNFWGEEKMAYLMQKW